MDTDRELTTVDDDVVDWRSQLMPAPSNLPATSEDDGVEDAYQGGGQPHGGAPDVPTTPNDYQLPVVPGFEFTDADAPNLESFFEVAHDADLTQRQAQLLLAWYARGVAEAGDGGSEGAIGIPESATGYSLPSGTWSKADEPLLEQFLATMHEAGAPQEHVSAALRFYQDLVAQQKVQTKALDDATREETKAALAKHVDVAQAGALVQSYLSDANLFPSGFIDKIKSARLPDGRKLVHDADVFAFLVGVAKDRYAGGTFDRKGQIEAIMKEDMGRYWREGLDEEYQTLIGSKQSGQQRPTSTDNRSWREIEIEKIMKEDMRRYWREGLDREYLELKRKRGA